MEVKYLVISTGVWYEDDYICFCRIGEDEWGNGGYFHEIEVYETITHDDGTVETNPFAYREQIRREGELVLGETCVYRRQSIGHTSLESAWHKGNHLLETVVSHWLPELLTDNDVYENVDKMEKANV